MSAGITPSGGSVEVQRSSVAVGGVSLAVSDTGDTGTPVLLVHGMGLDQRMWRPQVGPLAAAGYRVITFDSRGHGQSGVPESGYTVVAFADEAMGVLDALGIERAHILGLSMGGSIVARMAVRWPDRIASVTVIGAMPCGYPRLSEWMRQGATASMVMDGTMDLATYREQRLSSFLYAPTLADPVAGPLAHEVLIDALQTTAVLRETTLERAAGWPSPTDWDLWIRPDRPVPALVMAGSLDEPTFQSFARDARELPRATGFIVEGSAHLANISHAALVNELVLEHLAASDSNDHG
jgi:pimeloyl-ACP methyl ester carboxylesterase